MSLTTERRATTMVIAAPVAGRVHLHPPKDLCGELEVFGAGETIATVASVRKITAPASGFVVRELAPEGAIVGAGSPILIFSVVHDA